jgi:HlyD family secretion protein
MMRRAVLVVGAIAALAVGAALLAMRPPGRDPGFQGYVEGYLIFMAPEDGGRIETLGVEAGDEVAAGRFLFAVDPAVQEARVTEAKARLEQAQAQLSNLEAALQRPEQIAVLRAQEEQAQAQLDLSQAELERQKTLFARGYSAQAKLDQAQSAFDRDKAALAQVRRSIEAGEIAGRTAEIEAAQAAVQVARAALDQAKLHLSRQRVTAPEAARVEDIYFRAGEVVNAGQPVLALLPPRNRRIRFYVPEPALSTLALGQIVAVTCDRCAPGQTASVSFIAREAEYTPPVIFSEAERAKLVFRVEAIPQGENGLPIGLPVSVRPIAAGS